MYKLDIQLMIMLKIQRKTLNSLMRIKICSKVPLELLLMLKFKSNHFYKLLALKHLETHQGTRNHLHLTIKMLTKLKRLMVKSNSLLTVGVKLEAKDEQVRV